MTQGDDWSNGIVDVIDHDDIDQVPKIRGNDWSNLIIDQRMMLITHGDDRSNRTTDLFDYNDVFPILEAQAYRVLNRNNWSWWLWEMIDLIIDHVNIDQI